MPPQTRSRVRMPKATPKETKLAKGGTTRKSASKSTSKAPPKKKARKDNSPPEKEAEKHSVLQFANLPLELFLEIAKHIYPLDLIRLSQANKLLRSMFMRRSAAEIWRAALNNIGLPPCPDESMSEPKYAALVFLEQCSECCKAATHCMDPIFLVRLCYACRKYTALKAEAVGDLARVLTHSQYLVPSRAKTRPKWYLREEYEEIKEMADELEGGDDNVWRDWVKGRARFVLARHVRAKPLVRWLEKREEEDKQAKKQATNELKNARAAQVEARLLKLGWELADIREGENYCDEWVSLIYRVKPLNNHDWKNILPYLLDGLERAREDRLIDESIQRKKDRERIAEDWLNSLSDRLRPTNISLRWETPGNNVATGPTNTPHATLYPQGVEKHNITICISSIPPSYHLITHCPHLKELLVYDRPTEEFQLEFQEQESFLEEQYSTWRTNLEAALVKTLPGGLKPVDTHNSTLELLPVAHMADVDLAKSEDHLSVDLKVLLRADVRFKRDSAAYYYPTGFNYLMDERSRPVYDATSSAAAQAILDSLQRPDASYLEMRGLGKSFSCARCIDDPRYYTWDEIVAHYICEDKTWKEIENSNQLRDKKITILPTHDSGKAHENPLVYIVAKEDQVRSSKNPQSECKVCLSIEHRYRTGASYIVRHIREVHLVEDPILGEHYTKASHSY